MANKGDRTVRVRDPARVLETHVDKYRRTRTGSVTQVHHVAWGWMSTRSYYWSQKAHQFAPYLAAGLGISALVGFVATLVKEILPLSEEAKKKIEEAADVVAGAAGAVATTIAQASQFIQAEAASFSQPLPPAPDLVVRCHQELRDCLKGCPPADTDFFGNLACAGQCSDAYRRCLGGG